jgi:hypothetical protein
MATTAPAGTSGATGSGAGAHAGTQAGAQQPQKPGGIQVAKPGGTCAVSGRAITAGERFMAAVRETPAGLERIDVAPEHWEAFDKAGLLAFWQTVMPRAEEKKKVFVDDEVLCNLFERLADATEPAKIHFRFVLGLILMRKRLVLYDATRHEEEGPGESGPRDVWVVRMKGREDKLDLVDPKLDEKQVMEVSQQLGEILNEEL